MKPTLLRRNIFVKKSSIHGYGVFAGEAFAQNDVIEECHVLARSSADTVFDNYYFEVPGKNNYLLALGFGSLYNHSSSPNAYYRFDPENVLLIIMAEKDIKKGEEICIFYCEDWFTGRKMKEIKPSHYRYHFYRPLLSTLLRFTVVVSLLFGLVMFLNIR